MRLLRNLAALLGLVVEKQITASKIKGVVGNKGMTIPAVPSKRAEKPAMLIKTHLSLCLNTL